MQESDDGKRTEFGVLFVGGIGKQRPGSTVVSFAGALYGWLFRSAHAACLSSDWAPVLRETRLSAEDGDGGPACAVLSVPLRLGGAWRKPEWLLAESSWTEVSDLPQFMDLARWIFKVSTCLLIMQFVIPLRRYWDAAHEARVRRSAGGRPAAASAEPGMDGDERPGWLPSMTAVLGYLILMGIAAMLSVPLSLALVVLAIMAKLPIPRIDQAVHWVIMRLSAALGDSYLLAHCPVQFAAMRTRVARDLAWLQSQCQTVAVVAHSQGAAIAHQVLKDAECPVGNVTAFVTLGQGIAKLHLLQRLDWDPAARAKALWSRLFVTIGLFLAGLPAVGFVVGPRAGASFPAVVAAAPLSLVLVAGGLAGIGIGVRFAIGAVGTGVQDDVLLPAARDQLTWTDYYASADPVSNGRLILSATGTPQDVQDKQSMLPRRCYEVFNRGSLLTDHNSYLRNQDQMVSGILNDLVAAAYSPGEPGPLVSELEFREVARRRRRLVDWLILGRVLAAALGIALWRMTPVTTVQKSMNSLAHLGDAHIGIGSLLARLLAVALVTGVAYLAAGILPWKAMQIHVQRRFFDGRPSPETEEHDRQADGGQPEPSAACPVAAL